MAINTLTISGNVGRDAELRSTQSGTSVSSFSLAAKSGWGDNEKTNWVKCVMWGKLADNLAQYIKKGMPLTVTGEFSMSEWTTEDGEKRNDPECNVRDVQLPPRNAGAGNDGMNQDPGGQPPANAAPIVVDDDDDIPF